MVIYIVKWLEKDPAQQMHYADNSMTRMKEKHKEIRNRSKSDTTIDIEPENEAIKKYIIISVEGMISLINSLNPDE